MNPILKAIIASGRAFAVNGIVGDGTVWQKIEPFGKLTSFGSSQTESEVRFLTYCGENTWVLGLSCGVAYQTKDDFKTFNLLELNLNTGVEYYAYSANALECVWSDGNGLVIATSFLGESSISYEYGDKGTFIRKPQSLTGTSSASLYDFATDGNVIIGVGGLGFAVRSFDKTNFTKINPTGLNSGLSYTTFYSVVCIGPETFIAAGDNSRSAITFDSGTTWTGLPRPLVSGSLTSSVYYSAISPELGTAIITSNNGELFFTNDFAATWEKRLQASPGPVAVGPEKQILWNAGNNSKWSGDYFETWQVLDIPWQETSPLGRDIAWDTFGRFAASDNLSNLCISPPDLNRKGVYVSHSKTSVDSNSSTSISVSFGGSDLTDKTFVVIAVMNEVNDLNTPSGWTKVSQYFDTSFAIPQGITLYTREWRTGDPTSVTFSSLSSIAGRLAYSVWDFRSWEGKDLEISDFSFNSANYRPSANRDYVSAGNVSCETQGIAIMTACVAYSGRDYYWYVDGFTASSNSNARDRRLLSRADYLYPEKPFNPQWAMYPSTGGNDYVLLNYVVTEAIA